MKTITISILIGVWWMCSTSVLSQVTIGMGEAPSKLGLLQLKDQQVDASNVTSTKGGLISSSFPMSYTGTGALKINVNQSDFVTLSGTQSYGLLMAMIEPYS